MRDLLRDPLWRAEDLGRPIPDSPHATSVCLPTWASVVGYEEGDDAIVNAMVGGYPRFVFHPFVCQLNELCEALYAGSDERSLALPSHQVAQRAVAYLERHAGVSARIDDFASHGIHIVTLPATAWDHAKAFWQHGGEVVSSRLAAAALNHQRPPADDGVATLSALRARISSLYGVDAEDVFLYPSGMAAISAAQRQLANHRPGQRSAQIGFPYVDVLKVQERFGPGAELIAADAEASHHLAELLAREPLSGCVIEIPGNPLLSCADLPGIAAQIHQADGLVIADDTIASPYNVDLLPHADLVMSSLTKYVSGVGDVMAGCLVVSPHSPHAAALRQHLATEPCLLFADDAAALLANAADFETRMQAINDHALSLATFLAQHPAVATVRYPALDQSSPYHALRRDGRCGYGGLLSFEMTDPARAPQVFDALRVSKGPSLGTNFTLACPFTLLAHYNELDWAATYGVRRDLIRISVGLEDDLIERFTTALNG
ncbi:MAG: PLP-dependent transferase [Planctomycetota bacterium]|jgi:cystathionine gamma-synthase